MDAFERAVFERGRDSLATFARSGPTLHAVTRAAWFRSGLPDGALAMADTYAQRTASWRASAAFVAIQQQLQALLGQVAPADPEAAGAAAGIDSRLAALDLHCGASHSTQSADDPLEPVDAVM